MHTICVASAWCYPWHIFKYNRRWNTTVWINPKTFFCVIDIQTPKWLYLSARHTKQVTSAASSQRATLIQRSGDHKGAAFPLKISKLIRVRSLRRSNFLAPPKLLKTQILQHQWGNLNHYQNLNSYITAWRHINETMHALKTYILMIHCLQ